MILPIVGAGALGAIAGSFLATLVRRWPEGKDAGGRSTCESCGKTLGALELVPVVSYVALRRRCRHCDAPIAAEHVLIELSCAAIGIAAIVIAPPVEALAIALFGWLLLALGWMDAKTLWLSDRLMLALAVSGLALGTLASGVWIVERLIGGGVAMLALGAVRGLYQLLRGRDGMGSGDPKLFGAIGLWLGWTVLPLVLLVGAGSLLVVALITRRTESAREWPLGTGLALGAFATLVLMRTGALPA